MEFTLRSGGLWILPYDSNPRTKLPCNFQGHHAHWGIVVGALLHIGATARSAAATDTPTRDDGAVTILPRDSSLEGPSVATPETRAQGCTGPSNGKAYWMVQHSLSSKWVIEPMDKWVDSNRQLVSLNDDKFQLGTGGRLNLRNNIIQVLPA